MRRITSLQHVVAASSMLLLGGCTFGPQELIIILAIVVLLFGASRLPQLEAAGITCRYLEYGSYLGGWRERLAIKLFTGWPTFPQVFVRGVLIGGADETAAGLADGSLRDRLDGA